MSDDISGNHFIESNHIMLLIYRVTEVDEFILLSDKLKRYFFIPSVDIHPVRILKNTITPPGIISSK